MTLTLPQAFLEKMKLLLGQEYADFVGSYGEQRLYGLRANTLKIAVDTFREQSPFSLTEIVPWCETGFYYLESDRPGKHPHYHAGLYYIQEPSAMLPAELVDARPGERVLDLCAAPGGKSTQLAAGMKHRGVLVVNDNNSDRVKALVKNLELFGVRNSVVLNETPERMARYFPEYFDKILVDAPCSGEGMFRKDELMVKQWEEGTVERYAAMQRDILRHAAAMLAPGGRLVYSTCTFSPEENERTVAEFLDGHPVFDAVPIPMLRGFVPGRPDWTADVSEQAKLAVRHAVRLWPHRIRGEGHFVAVLERQAGVASARDRSFAGDGRRTRGKSGSPSKADIDLLRNAIAELAVPSVADDVREGRLTAFGEHLYRMPEGLPVLDGLKVIRPGWYLGAARKQRYEPSHAFAMGLGRGDGLRTLNLRSDEPDVIRYLKGETLEVAAARIEVREPARQTKGYTLVCVDGYPLGWGKWHDGMLKNEYPPGWRWM